jgi:restriction system protein
VAGFLIGERHRPCKDPEMPQPQRADLPSYQDLIYPVLKAVDGLGGSAQAREITSKVIEAIGASDDLAAITYDNRPKSILVDRIEWARSYAKLGGALDSPRRGLYLLTTYGKDLLTHRRGGHGLD